jgi:hypothetical protein
MFYVHQDDVEGLMGEQVQGLPAVGHAGEGVAHRLQHEREGPAVQLVIVDYENPKALPEVGKNHPGGGTPSP